MGADSVNELVLGAAAVGPTVGEEDGSAAQSEEAVGEEHRAVIAKVPIEGYVLHADH